MSGYQRLFLMAGMLAAAFILLCLHVVFYYPFLSDDALISLRYADRLLDGKGLTWTDGKPVEGYSNLLWVLLIAALGFLGMDLIDAARLLGLLGMASVMISLLHWHLYRAKGRSEHYSVATSLLFFCMAAPTAAWGIGGLEQPLYAALIALSIPLTVQVIESDEIRSREILSLSFILGLASIARLDGPLFSVASFLAICIGRFASNKKNVGVGDVIRLAIFPLQLYGGQLLFRLYYYGEFVPNTALVKISPSIIHLKLGFMYMLGGMWGLVPFSLLAVASLVICIRSPLKRSMGITLSTTLLLWTLYLIFIGGDIFPAHRHFVPIIVVFTFALADGANWFISSAWRPKTIQRKTTYAICAVAIFLVFLNIQFTIPQNTKAAEEMWEWDGKVIGLLLKKAFSEEQPLIAVTAAGCIPYWSKLPALDMMGLNDYYLPRNPPEDIGHRIFAHELGDGAYVLSQEPDILIFHAASQNVAFKSGLEMLESGELFRLYTLVRVRGDDPHTYEGFLWVRKYSPKIGIERTPSRIIIPGYLFNGNRHTVAYADETGKLVIPISSSNHASILLDSGGGQDWKVSIKASRKGAVQHRLLQEGTTLTVALISESLEPVEVEEVVLTRNGTDGEHGVSTTESLP